MVNPSPENRADVSRELKGPDPSRDRAVSELEMMIRVLEDHDVTLLHSLSVKLLQISVRFDRAAR